MALDFLVFSGSLFRCAFAYYSTVDSRQYTLRTRLYPPAQWDQYVPNVLLVAVRSVLVLLPSDPHAQLTILCMPNANGSVVD